MDVANLVTRARDSAAPEAERHHAFAELVRRFEDLAIGCAYSRLRGAALAEDAAQDAFLLAWERLDQLREPAAFAGWIRRLVLTDRDLVASERDSMAHLFAGAIGVFKNPQSHRHVALTDPRRPLK